MYSEAREQAEHQFQGLGVSVGVAVGAAVRMDSRGRHALFIRVLPQRVSHEIKRLHRAVQTARHHVERIKQRLQREFGVSHGYILDPHILMLEDPMLVRRIEEVIRTQHVNAEWGVKLAVNRFLSEYESIHDDYLRERAGDIQDIAGRLIDVLSGRRTHNLHLTQPSIIVAEDILPTVMAELDLTNVLGIATDAGGWTSHTAIIARSLGLPAVLGLGDFAAKVNSGDWCIVNGSDNFVILNPTEATRRQYLERHAREQSDKRDVLEHVGLPSVTLDNESCLLRANLELVSELPVYAKSGARGIGLFRSEYLFLNSLPDLPTEAVQFDAYRRLIDSVGDDGVCIRTFDLGSDKIKTGEMFAEERNPALGLHGIRFALKYRDIFRTQLRALLRAGHAGRLSLMLPKVGCIDELRTVKRLISEVKNELAGEGLPHAQTVPLGVMIETPSAVWTCDVFAAEADFLSIGSNDLIQYTLAVDRVNPHVANLYEPLHPAVLRSLRRIVEAGRSAGAPVQICGEMAANPMCAVVLLGMGVRNFSMAPAALPNIKRLIRCVRLSEAERIYNRVTEMDTPTAIDAFLHAELPRAVPQFFRV